MSELYLICHLVRSEPAFDIATRMRCPLCQGVGGHKVPDFETGVVSDYDGSPCHECDGEGYWWIIPTSGHRAYPYWFNELNQGFSVEDILSEIPIPASLPDHYTTYAAPRTGLITNLAERLGFVPKPITITRR